MIKAEIHRSNFVCVKAFHKVEPEILLKTAKSYGLPRNTYNWF